MKRISFGSLRLSCLGTKTKGRNEIRLVSLFFCVLFRRRIFFPRRTRTQRMSETRRVSFRPSFLAPKQGKHEKRNETRLISPFLVSTRVGKTQLSKQDELRFAPRSLQPNMTILLHFHDIFDQIHRQSTLFLHEFGHKFFTFWTKIVKNLCSFGQICNRFHSKTQ